MTINFDQILPASAISAVVGWVAKAWQHRKQLAFGAEKVSQIMHHVAVLLETSPAEDPATLAVKMIRAQDAGVDLSVAKALIQATPATSTSAVDTMTITPRETHLPAAGFVVEPAIPAATIPTATEGSIAIGEPPPAGVP